MRDLDREPPDGLSQTDDGHWRSDDDSAWNEFRAMSGPNGWLQLFENPETDAYFLGDGEGNWFLTSVPFKIAGDPTTDCSSCGDEARKRLGHGLPRGWEKRTAGRDPDLNIPLVEVLCDDCK